MKLRITVQGVKYDVDVEVLDQASGEISSSASTTTLPSGSGGGEVTSPIAGTVFDIRVKIGDTVKVNDTVLVLEAMKMESNIASDQVGTVSEICVKVGDSVTHGQVLIRFQ